MAAISLSLPYTQSFDTLINTGSIAFVDDSTLPGWYAARTGTVNLVAGDGSSTTGNLYSFGTGTQPDRALGSVGSGATGTVTWGVQLKNNTTNTITGLNIGYTGEQWRNSGATAAQTVDFQYQIGATNLTTGTWTTFSPLSFTSPTFTGTAGALNGNLAANQSVFSNTLLSGISVAPGQEIWLRWSDIDHPSADHGLAIDNFSVSAVGATTAVPEPSDFMGTIVAVLAVAIVKRKLSRKSVKLS